MNCDRCSTARGGSRPCHTYVRWPFSAPPPWPSTGDTGDHHRQQEPGPVEVREARGLCDGVGAQHPGQPPGRGRGQLGGCLQEVQQRHVSGLLALWPPHPRNGPTSPNPQTQGDLLWHPGHTPHTHLHTSTRAPCAVQSGRGALHLRGHLFVAWILCGASERGQPWMWAHRRPLDPPSGGPWDRAKGSTRPRVRC